MEEVLEQLVKECQGSKFNATKDACKYAKDLLENQSSLLQSTPSELRAAFFHAFQIAIETKHNRIVALAVSAFHRLLRDNQFYSTFEENDETSWLPYQLITAIHSLPEHPEDIQVELLKVLLNMSCIPNITMSSHLVIEIIHVCGLAYGRGNLAMQSASQSAAIQAIIALINQLATESLEQEAKKRQDSSLPGTCDESYSSDCFSPYDELVPILNSFAETLTDATKNREHEKEGKIPVLFILECANSLLRALAVTKGPESSPPCHRHHLKEKFICCPPAYCSTLFMSSLWQRLCPAIISLLGTPVCQQTTTASRHPTIDQVGRRMGTSVLPTVHDSQEVKAFYSVTCSLIITTGMVGDMRPVLESLLHRMLLYPPPNGRNDALRAILELLKVPSKLIQLAGPILHSDPRNLYQCDLALFRLVMESLVDCSSHSEIGLQVMAVAECVAGLLGALETIAEGNVLSSQQVSAVNKKYERLEDVDYLGPITYATQNEIKHLVTSESVSSGDLSNLAEILAPTDDSDDGPIKEENDDTDDDDVESRGSGYTEGPEDVKVKDMYPQHEQDLREEKMRLIKLSQSLQSDAHIQVIKDEEQERDISNACHFCSTLNALLPSLLSIRSTIEVDEAILEFSSKYCQGVFSEVTENKKSSIIINADGIYLATYAVLSLNFKLIRSGYYCNPDGGLSIIVTKDQFIENVFASGILVYLPLTWVSELYSQVLSDSFLQRAGYNPTSPYNCSLINLLTDLDGLGSIDQGSQMLSDFRRLDSASIKAVPKSETREAGKKLSRRILSSCWDSLMVILERLLKCLEGEKGMFDPVCFLLRGDSAKKDESKRSQEMLILCLNALQSAAKLAPVLGLQSRCGVVFSLLSWACLPRTETSLFSVARIKPKKTYSFMKKPFRLHKAHILSFQVMISSGLELGSYSTDCWGHLFRCCLYLAELEHKVFDGSETVGLFENNYAHAKLNYDLPRSSSEFYMDEMLYSPSPATSDIKGFSPPSLVPTIDCIMQEFDEDSNSSGFLSPQLSKKALCSLSLLVDKFFDDAVMRLNLASLVSFFAALCEASHSQLFSRRNRNAPKRNFLIWSTKMKEQTSAKELYQSLSEDVLLLHKICEALLKVVRSGRPLIHIMRVWAVGGPHFLEAACHSDRAVNKKAISCIHDVVNYILGSQVELPYFHFNEVLFKPFEDLLRLELCDIEVQDQIVSSICEFVESCSSEIHSGWRSLFGALRCVRIVPVLSQPTFQNGKGDIVQEQVGHLRTVKDIFEAFLATDNVVVFANAALDCILCLLKHVKGPEDEQVSEKVVCWGELVGGDLCLDALRYLHRCAIIFSSMYAMSTVPVFHSAHRMSFNATSHLIDANLPGIDELYLWQLINDFLDVKKEPVKYSCLWLDPYEESIAYFSDTNEDSGLIRVWYILLEGLAGSLITCPRRYQTQVLDTLFTLMKALPTCPGPEFGMFCANNLLFPHLQQWLRKLNESQQQTSWELAQAFKQYVGLTSDLVVEYIISFSKETIDSDKSCKLMLQQCLLVLTECICCSCEVIARLGCSCIRHIVLSCGHKFSSELWDIIVYSIHRASQVSLFPVYQLMHLFCPMSPNFYGDKGEVKVAARRDSTGRETDRLRQLSHQVFLLNGQHRNEIMVENNGDMEDRSFIFLLYPQDKLESHSYEDGLEGELPLRITFRGLVVGLLANQMIIQMLGMLLVDGSHRIVPSLANVLLQASDFARTGRELEKTQETTEIKLPGLLQWMSMEQILILLDSLKLSFEVAVHFDRRPGLKFLIQKVANSDRAANLYKQAGASWTLRMLTLFDMILCKVKMGLGIDEVKLIVEQMEDKAAFEPDSMPQNTEKRKKILVNDTKNSISMLAQCFNELCDTYLQLVSSLGHDETFDMIHDQPIFFLSIPADEFPTAFRSNLEKWTESLEDFNRDFMKTKKIASDGVLDISLSSSLPVKMTLCSLDQSEEVPKVISVSDNEKKISCFADLADACDDYQSDDESRSGSTRAADSGVHSASDTWQNNCSVVEEPDISAMMGVYRKRKLRHSLPPPKVNPFLEPSEQPCHPPQPVPAEIEEQRSKSLMKDSEAHITVWTEMIMTVFDLLDQLPDCELKPLLPVFFPTLQSLVAHAHDPHLRQDLTYPSPFPLVSVMTKAVKAPRKPFISPLSVLSNLHDSEEALTSFREKWHRELENSLTEKDDLDKRSDADSYCIQINNSKSTDNDIRSDTERMAAELFKKGVHLEQTGHLYESVSFYKRAISLIPDIELRVHNRYMLEGEEGQNLSPVAAAQDGERKFLMTESTDLISNFEGSFSCDQHFCQPLIPQETTHLSCLPAEMMEKILAWVVGKDHDFNSLENLSLVCRGFYFLCRKPDLWKKACVNIWDISSTELGIYSSWRDMYICRPRPRFSGCYISRTTYFRSGEKSFQDLSYQLWQLVSYYRYMRFFPNGRVLMLTTSEEPQTVVGHLKTLNTKHPQVLHGFFRLHGSSLTMLFRRSPGGRGSNIKRDKGTTNVADTTLQMELQLRTVKGFHHWLLAWQCYSVVSTYHDGSHATSVVDVSDSENFPRLSFSEVRSYSTKSEQPLS